MDDIEKSLTGNDDRKYHTLSDDEMTSEEFKTWINFMEKESLIELSEAKNFGISKSKRLKRTLWMINSLTL